MKKASEARKEVERNPKRIKLIEDWKKAIERKIERAIEKNKFLVKCYSLDRMEMFGSGQYFDIQDEITSWVQSFGYRVSKHIKGVGPNGTKYYWEISW
tara:strand:+ start:152 stop:445 length:294 start_codon:yes stop_codon:yes gene_type:complete